MSLPKFNTNSKVRVLIDGKARLGRVAEVIPGAKRNARRLYNVIAESNGATLGTFRSDELTFR